MLNSPVGLKIEGLSVYEYSLSLTVHLYWFSIIRIDDENAIEAESKLRLPTPASDPTL